MHYKSIFMSDIHLGLKGCQANLVSSFLKENTCENLFLVGDIIDGWKLKKKWNFPQSHVNVISRIFTLAKHGTNVIYLTGNHDEFLREFTPFSVGNIKVMDEYSYTGINGKKYLIIHGDFFDILMKKHKWLMNIGSTAYSFSMWANVNVNKARATLGLSSWSVSKWLKSKTKKALNFIHKFEQHMGEYCKEYGYDGVICGHIHTPEIKKIGSIDYFNIGDCVESGTAIVEYENGTFELVKI